MCLARISQSSPEKTKTTSRYKVTIGSAASDGPNLVCNSLKPSMARDNECNSMCYAYPSCFVQLLKCVFAQMWVCV